MDRWKLSDPRGRTKNKSSIDSAVIKWSAAICGILVLQIVEEFCGVRCGVDFSRIYSVAVLKILQCEIHFSIMISTLSSGAFVDLCGFQTSFSQIVAIRQYFFWNRAHSCNGALFGIFDSQFMVVYGLRISRFLLKRSSNGYPVVKCWYPAFNRILDPAAPLSASTFAAVPVSYSC